MDVNLRVLPCQNIDKSKYLFNTLNKSIISIDLIFSLLQV